MEQERADIAGGTWLKPAATFDGARLRDDLWISVAGGRVAVTDRLPAAATAAPLPGTVTPGFVDLQVNGGGGVLLNRSPTVEGMVAIAAAHRAFGTVAILPTVITDAPGVLAAATDAAIAAHAAGLPGIAGLHIEGPHIALARRGTHAAVFIRPLDDETIGHVARLRAADVPVMITVAPEACAPGQIAALAAAGAIVSLGHTEATQAQTDAALSEGARAFTHLFNAMPPLLNRAPGVAAHAINSPATAGLICDGIHVDDAMLALAIRARPVADAMFLVSDAMPTVGGPDTFDLYGQTLHLRDGRLVNAEGSLAGAHLTMAMAVARLVTHVGIPLEDALRMAVTVPARLMGLVPLAGLDGRQARDVLVLRDDLAVQGTLADALPPGP